MRTSNSLKVFIQEDDLDMQRKIANELEQYNYRISFFSKHDSAFELLNLNPDILIQDYTENKMVKYYEWAK